MAPPLAHSSSNSQEADHTNLLSYVLGAVNLFNSDRPRNHRFDAKRAASNAWAWSRRHPDAATAAFVGAGLLVLFAWLFW